MKLPIQAKKSEQTNEQTRQTDKQITQWKSVRTPKRLFREKGQKRPHYEELFLAEGAKTASL